MKNVSRSILIFTVILSLLVSGISCSKPSTQTPESPPVEEKSNTEQIMDVVLGYLDHVKNEETMTLDEWGDIVNKEYFHLFDFYDRGIDSRSHFHLQSALDYTSSDIMVRYSFPQIQENFASMKVTLNYPDFLDNPHENIFTFLLKKRSSDYVNELGEVRQRKGDWRIVDYYLSYTEVPLWEDDVR